MVCRSGRVDIGRCVCTTCQQSAVCSWEVFCFLHRSPVACPLYLPTLLEYLSRQRRNRLEDVSQVSFPTARPAPYSARLSAGHFNCDSSMCGNDSASLRVPAKHKPLAPPILAQPLRPQRIEACGRNKRVDCTVRSCGSSCVAIARGPGTSQCSPWLGQFIESKRCT